MESQQETSLNSIANRQKLFDIYITPNLVFIRRIVTMYTYNKSNLDDYYNEVLENFYKYIESYNPEKSLQTWLHIVAKRFVLEAASKNVLERNDDVNVESFSDHLLDENEPIANMLSTGNYEEYYSDDVLNALNSLKPIYKEALIMQQAGYTLSEMTDILYEEGKLKTHNIETVKSRVFLAKEQMRELVTRDGNKKAS